MKKKIILVLAVCALVTRAQETPQADTNSWVESTKLKLKDMKFDFSRAESDIPFLPVLSLGYTVYGKSEFQRVDGTGPNEEFRSQVSSAYTMVPLYIGKSGLLVAVPVVSHTLFNFTTGDLPDRGVTALYLPVGGMRQTEAGNQWGGFVMPAGYSPLSGQGAWAWSGMGGVIGRHMSGERLTWYYGLVYDYSFSDGYFLPYVGFTYIVDPGWAISMIAPWPAVSYAPCDWFFVRLGVAPSGASWALDRKTDGAEQVTTSIGGWNLGLWANWRLGAFWWLAVGSGVSGLRSFEINQNGSADFDQSIGSEPWVSLSISLRPGN